MPWCCEDETTPASEQTLDWALRGSELHIPAPNEGKIIFCQRRKTDQLSCVVWECKQLKALYGGQ